MAVGSTVAATAKRGAARPRVCSQLCRGGERQLGMSLSIRSVRRLLTSRLGAGRGETGGGGRAQRGRQAWPRQDGSGPELLGVDPLASSRREAGEMGLACVSRRTQGADRLRPGCGLSPRPLWGRTVLRHHCPGGLLRQGSDGGRCPPPDALRTGLWRAPAGGLVGDRPTRLASKALPSPPCC